MQIARDMLTEKIERLRVELERQCKEIEVDGAGLEKLGELSRELDLLIVDYLRIARDGSRRK